MSGSTDTTVDPRSFIHRIVGQAPSERDEEPDSTSYKAVSEVQRPAAMLMLRFRTGNVRAIGYGYLVDAEYDPSRGITLSFVGHKVLVQGRHLAPLFDKLSDHRVEWIREHDESEGGSESTALVTKIQVSTI